jgi:transposase
MAGRRKDLDDIRDIIKRLRLGHPLKRIVRETGVSRKTLRRYQRLSRREGWLGGELPDLAVLEAGLRKVPASVQRQISKAEAHREVITALVAKGVEAKAIHGILRDSQSFIGSYASVQRFVKKLKSRTPTAVLRVEVAPGAQAQIDFGDALLAK